MNVLQSLYRRKRKRERQARIKATAGNKLALLRNYPAYALSNWSLYDKQGVRRPFKFNPAQKAIDQVKKAQITAGLPVRIRVLKFRQAGVSTYCMGLLQHLCQTYSGCTALSLADKADLPIQWLRRCKEWLYQTSDALRPHPGATPANEIYFDKLQSRLYIGSAEGTTPGMGATLRAIHCSEVASWHDPESLLFDLMPAIPPGPGTYVIQESTGRHVGDWWYQRYYEAKRGEDHEGQPCGFEAIFLPWLIQPEYRADPVEIREIREDEKALLAAGADKEQLAWRRDQLRTYFHNDVEGFSNQFPATEAEAFLAAGRNVFAQWESQVRRTCRKPVWTGEIIPDHNPATFHLVRSDAGRLLIWEYPKKNLHYALGADCQWGKSEEADYDACYVECAETRKICAAIWGRMDMGLWAKMLASLSHHYNQARLGPERNTEAGKGVIRPLLGLAGNNWSYPNLYVRDRLKKFGAPVPEDYGWFTDPHTKPDLVIAAMEALESTYGLDMADDKCVDEMVAWIVNEKSQYTHPEGQYDDRLMARLITHKIAEQLRSELLTRRPASEWGELTDSQVRVIEHIEKMDKLDKQAIAPAAEW